MPARANPRHFGTPWVPYGDLLNIDQGLDMTGEGLTDLAIRKMSPVAGRRFEIWDKRLPGFGLRVTAAGVKTFVVMYRLNGVKRRLTLGRYPMLSLAEARQQAMAALTKVTRCVDPADPVLAVTDEHHRFEDVVTAFVAMHCARHNRPNTARETERLLRMHFQPMWQTRDIATITRKDVLAVLDKIVARGTPILANRALAAVRKLFNWCIERSLLEQSPCAGMKLPTKPVVRERVLNESEIAAVWESAGAAAYPFGAIVRLLLLTAQRRGEVAEMRWAELNLDKALWVIPAARTKSNRTHTVPLSALAMTTIASIPRIDDTHVFPAETGEGTFQGFSKAKHRLDRACAVMNWTLHDLRRSAATHIAGLGAPPHVVERLLNHTSGTFGGVAGVYNRFSYLDEMRAAVESWAKKIQALVERTQSLNAPRANAVDVT